MPLCTKPAPNKPKPKKKPKPAPKKQVGEKKKRGPKRGSTTGYIEFSKMIRPTVSDSFGAVSQLIGAKWKELDPTEKDEWRERAKKTAADPQPTPLPACRHRYVDSVQQHDCVPHGPGPPAPAKQQRRPLWS